MLANLLVLCDFTNSCRFWRLFALSAASAFAGQDTPASPRTASGAAQPQHRQPRDGAGPTASGRLSGPVICTTELRFHPVNESIIEAQTYLYYIQTPLSRPADSVWVPFNEQTEQSLLEDFKRLWATSFLDNLWIETLDEHVPKRRARASASSTTWKSGRA